MLGTWPCVKRVRLFCWVGSWWLAGAHSVAPLALALPVRVIAQVPIPLFIVHFVILVTSLCLYQANIKTT